MTIKQTTRRQTTQSLFVGQSATVDAPDDFVSYLVRVMVSAGVKAEVAARVGHQVTDEWGGDRPYIAKRAGLGRSERNDAIRRDYSRGESITMISQRHELSRQHVYRILGISEPA